MANINAVNIGIITENDVIGFHLEKLLTSGKYFRILTVRRNCREKYSQVKDLVTEWCKKKLELIFVVGSTILDESMHEISHILKEDMPHLALLVSLKLEYQVFQSCFYYIKEKSLIVKLPLNLDSFELYFEKTGTVLLNAIKEIQTNSVLSFQGQAPKLYFCKSNVKVGNLAERPRKSVYEMISVNKAVECILQESSPLGTEYKNFRDCHMFVLAENVIAEEPYPSFPASVKDGYAVIAEDDSKLRKVIDAATPGYKPDCTIVKGTCVRVSTGSVIPHGANAVIQVEDTLVAQKDEKGEEVMIEILKFPHVQQDIRAVGSDVAKGQVLISANTKILAAEIGIMSVCGIQKALVYRKPWIALLSTGDEVLEPEMPVKPGCIRDSNKSSIMHMIIENKIPVIDVGIARDTPDDVKSHLMLAFEAADVIISTGGVSMGERDMLKLVLEQDFGAKIHFGRIHMKPGKPTTFSTAIFEDKKKLIFSLPGNPVSAFVCFYLFVIPCIKKMMGFTQPRHPTIKVELSRDLQLDERPEFQRVSLSCNPDGTFLAHSTGGQQSSRLLSMQNADALLVLPPQTSEQSVLKKGSKVDAIFLNSIFGSILK